VWQTHTQTHAHSQTHDDGKASRGKNGQQIGLSQRLDFELLPTLVDLIDLSLSCWLVALAQWKNVGLWPAVFPCPAPDLQLTGDHSRG